MKPKFNQASWNYPEETEILVIGKPSKQKYCFIEWIDASMWGGDQISRKEAKDKYLSHGFVCGFLIHEDKEKVVIGMDWFDADDQFRVINTYPKTGIKKLIIKDFPIEKYDQTKQ